MTKQLIENALNKILYKGKYAKKDTYSYNRKEPTYDPEPDYKLCNAGHPLVQVYHEPSNRYRWDCPTCIRRMEAARHKR